MHYTVRQIASQTLSWWISHPKSILWSRCKVKLDITTNSIHQIIHTWVHRKSNAITTTSVKDKNLWKTIIFRNDFTSAITTGIASSWLVVIFIWLLNIVSWLFNSVTFAFPFLIFCLFRILYFASFSHWSIEK